MGCLCGGGGTVSPVNTGAVVAVAPCVVYNPVRFRVRIPPTQSVRGNDAVLPPAPPVFQSNSAARDLVGNPPLVVVRNTSDLLVELETNPANQAAQINFNITAESGTTNAVPASNFGAGTLGTDSCGHFQVSATSSDGATTIYLNLIIVDVTITNNVLQRYQNPLGLSVSSVGQERVTCELFEITGLTGAPHYRQTGNMSIDIVTDVTLVVNGTGAFGAYIDKVHLGFANCLNNSNLRATYTDASTVKERIPTTGAGFAAQQVITAGVFQDLGFPILDKGGANPATGGGTVFLAWHEENPANGANRTIINKDKPTLTFPLQHPVSHAYINAVDGDIDFSLYLLAYSDDAPYSYVSFGSVNWILHYDCAFNVALPYVYQNPALAVGAVNKAAAKAANVQNLNHVDNGSNVATPGGFVAIANGQEANAAGCELRPPAYKTFVFDAT